MITGVHAIVFTPAADEIRAFFRDVLEFESVDAGGGWPIFALPPAELAIHPHETNDQQIYLMCDDLEAVIASLEAHGVHCSRPISEQTWGRLTSILLPGGTEIALYQPKHPSPSRTSPRA